MPASIELPQCPICQDPFTRSGEKGRPMTPKACGHVYCKQCADAHFKNLQNPLSGQEVGNACPLCRLPCARNDLVELYLDFGRHDVHALPTFSKTGEDAKKVNDEEKEMLLSVKNLAISDRGERAIRKLGELVALKPHEWKAARTKAKNPDLGVFHLVGGVIRSVARSITDQENVKDVLQRLSDALSDLQKWHTKAMELAEDHARLRKRKEELKAELEEMKQKHERQLLDHERKLAAQAAEFADKQSELRRHIHEKSEELENERRNIDATEVARKRLEEHVERWKKDSSKNKKRLELKRQECDKLKAELDKLKGLQDPRRFDETSDSSLQVIEDDEDAALQSEDVEELLPTPPTSSLTSLKQSDLPLQTCTIERNISSQNLSSLVPFKQGSPLRQSHCSNCTSSIVALPKPKAKQMQPRHDAASVISERPKALARIPVMPVPSRKNTISLRASPKKKQRLIIDLE